MNPGNTDEPAPQDSLGRASTQIDGSTLRSAELDKLRAQVRAEHGDDVGAWLRAVFEHGDRGKAS